MFSKYINKISDYSFYVENLNSLEDKYKQCSYFIKEAKNICFLTGAGISTSCGIPDFRSKNGWYSKSPENILSFNNFLKNPYEVYEFLYKYYKLIDVEPSKSHNLIFELEKLGKNVTVITQNVDMLHSKSGSKNVIEFHGSFSSSNCIYCNKEYVTEWVLRENTVSRDKMVKCNCGGLIKPNITLFGESINEISYAEREISKADLVIVVGTSLQVSPFNQLPFKAPLECPFIVINKTATYLDGDRMSVVINENCDTVLENIIKI